MMGGSIRPGATVRGILIPAELLRTGDVLIGEVSGTVARKLGVQGRTPSNGARLMRLILSDGNEIRVREDAALRIQPRPL